MTTERFFSWLEQSLEYQSHALAELMLAHPELDASGGKITEEDADILDNSNLVRSLQTLLELAASASTGLKYLSEPDISGVCPVCDGPAQWDIRSSDWAICDKCASTMPPEMKAMLT